MVAKISRELAVALLKSNVINQEKLNVYAYGIQLLILNIFDWSITFLIMLLLGEIKLSVLYFAVFFLLRRHCGGYHARTHMGCVFVSNIVYSFSVMIAAYINDKYFSEWFVLGEILNFIILFKIAPVEHPNKPISKSEIKKHKSVGRILNIIISCIAFMLFFSQLNKYACVTLFAQLSVSIAILIEKGNQKKL